MNLVTDVKIRLKHFSTIALATAATLQTSLLTFAEELQGLWAALPPDIKDALGPDVNLVVKRVIVLVLVWGLLGKFVKQNTPGSA